MRNSLLAPVPTSLSLLLSGPSCHDEKSGNRGLWCSSFQTVTMEVGGSGMEYTFGKLEVAGIEDYWAVFDGGKCVGDFDEYDEAMAFCVEYSGKTVTV